MNISEGAPCGWKSITVVALLASGLLAGGAAVAAVSSLGVGESATRPVSEVDGGDRGPQDRQYVFGFRGTFQFAQRVPALEHRQLDPARIQAAPSSNGLSQSLLLSDRKSLEPTVAAVVRQQTGVAWSRARDLCREGRVTVDGERCLDPASRVTSGAVVCVDQHAPRLRGGALADSAIVFHDADVVVIDKPAGMLTVADESGNKDTLVDHTRTLLRRIGGRGIDRPLGVVHRLDKDTSGLIVFARTALAKRLLATQFREHTVDRIYHAIAHGIVPAKRLETYLVLDRGDRMRGSHGHFRASRGELPREAKRSITHIRPIARLTGATLVECRLETGRQHQIRIHLSELGHPLVGEQVYMRDYRGPRIDAARPMLHARTLGFVHPRSGERVSFAREPPDDFLAMLESLRPLLPGGNQ